MSFPLFSERFWRVITDKKYYTYSSTCFLKMRTSDSSKWAEKNATVCVWQNKQSLVCKFKCCDILIESLAHLFSITDSSNKRSSISLILLSLNCIGSSNWRKIYFVSHTCGPLMLRLYFKNNLESLRKSFWNCVASL